MKIQKVDYFKPQFAATHGLFSLKHSKRHNFRHISWTAKDLIEQYEKINVIFEKDNKVKGIKNDFEKSIEAEDFKRLKKERKDLNEELQTLLKGDVQRTKNVLVNFPLYMKMYQNKQSYEVLEELEYKTFHMTKKHDRLMRERDKHIKEYETQLLNVAHKQEIIRYYDIKEFQSERDTKRIMVELKNSETRLRGMESINQTYKYIIDQFLHDSLFYQPVIEALNHDWNEQTRLVQQTFNIGYPAIMHVKKMEKEVAKVIQLLKNELKERFVDIQKVNEVLKEHPKTVKQFVRRDSDFESSKDRYIRETTSMTEVREVVEKVSKDIKLLKICTLSPSAEDILTRIQSMFAGIGINRNIISGYEKDLKKATKQFEGLNYIRHFLLDDFPDVYKEELITEHRKVEQAINAEREARKRILESTDNLQKLIATMRFAMQHYLDVLRHVGSEDFYIEREYPNEDLELPLLKFNTNLPETPKIIPWDFEELLEIVTTKTNLLIQQYDEIKGTEDVDMEETMKTYQTAIIDDFFSSYRPKSPSLDFLM